MSKVPQKDAPSNGVQKKKRLNKKKKRKNDYYLKKARLDPKAPKAPQTSFSRPEDPQGFSSNWKQLLLNLTSSRTTVPAEDAKKPKQIHGKAVPPEDPKKPKQIHGKAVPPEDPKKPKQIHGKAVPPEDPKKPKQIHGKAVNPEDPKKPKQIHGKAVPAEDLKKPKQIQKAVPADAKKPKQIHGKAVPAEDPKKPKQIQKALQKLHRDSPSPANKPVQTPRPERSKKILQNQPAASEKRKRREMKRAEEKEEEEKKKKRVVPDIWFDDVDPDDLEAAIGPEAAEAARMLGGHQRSSEASTEQALVQERGFQGLTRAVAMDCEMVGVGPEGEDSILARVSIVNHFGKCIYDKYVKPTETVTDYRTAVSGIRPKDIENGEDMKTVQQEVAEILKGRLLVGHAVRNDLKVLFLDHPKKMLRDTQRYRPFKQRVKSSFPALRVLCKQILNVAVQRGEHSSVQDAQATMRLYTMVKKDWEAELKARGAERGKKKRMARPSSVVT